MIKKSTLEKVIQEDLSEIWSILDGDEKRRIVENFTTHTFKKNQIIYAEGEEPEFLWCLLKGKVKLYKDGIGGSCITQITMPTRRYGKRSWDP